ncbi:MAG: amidohydrolase family protein [Chloroflexota bacterium]
MKTQGGDASLQPEEIALLKQSSWLLSPEDGFPMGKGEMARNRLMDLGAGRLQNMDEGNIDIQVLSLTSPGVQMFAPAEAAEIARKTNNMISQTIRQHPQRYAGLATLAPQDPEGAAEELKRAVQELDFRGACINSHTRGEYLDDKKYHVILEAAAKLDVPIYIHPRTPSADMLKPYLAYPGLHGAILGFSAEVSLHALRLIFSGVFDKFPGLKIILGHLGEALPYWMWRIDNHWQRQAVKLKKSPSEYLRDNFYVTTSGMCWYPALLCAILALGADRILFAADYPHESGKEAADFMMAAPISAADKEKIMHATAEKLFKL